MILPNYEKMVELWKESEKDPSLFYDLLVQNEQEFAIWANGLKRKKTTKLQAIEMFKDMLPKFIFVKKKYDKENIHIWEQLEFLVSSDIKSDVEKARNTPVESFLDAIGHSHTRGRSTSPLSEGNNKTVFSFKDNLFYCFKTGDKGDVIKLCQMVTGKDFKESVNFLNKLT